MTEKTAKIAKKVVKVTKKVDASMEYEPVDDAADEAWHKAMETILKKQKDGKK